MKMRGGALLATALLVAFLPGSAGASLRAAAAQPPQAKQLGEEKSVKQLVAEAYADGGASLEEDIKRAKRLGEEKVVLQDGVRELEDLSKKARSVASRIVAQKALVKKDEAAAAKAKVAAAKIASERTAEPIIQPAIEEAAEQTAEPLMPPHIEDLIKKGKAAVAKAKAQVTSAKIASEPVPPRMVVGEDGIFREEIAKPIDVKLGEQAIKEAAEQTAEPLKRSANEDAVKEFQAAAADAKATMASAESAGGMKDLVKEGEGAAAKALAAARLLPLGVRAKAQVAAANIASEPAIEDLVKQGQAADAKALALAKVLALAKAAAAKAKVAAAVRDQIEVVEDAKTLADSKALALANAAAAKAKVAAAVRDKLEAVEKRAYAELTDKENDKKADKKEEKQDKADKVEDKNEDQKEAKAQKRQDEKKDEKEEKKQEKNQDKEDVKVLKKMSKKVLKIVNKIEAKVEKNEEKKEETKEAKKEIKVEKKEDKKEGKKEAKVEKKDELKAEINEEKLAWQAAGEAIRADKLGQEKAAKKEIKIEKKEDKKEDKKEGVNEAKLAWQAAGEAIRAHKLGQEKKKEETKEAKKEIKVEKKEEKKEENKIASEQTAETIIQPALKEGARWSAEPLMTPAIEESAVATMAAAVGTMASASGSSKALQRCQQNAASLEKFSEEHHTFLKRCMEAAGDLSLSSKPMFVQATAAAAPSAKVPAPVATQPVQHKKLDVGFGDFEKKITEEVAAKLMRSASGAGWNDDSRAKLSKSVTDALKESMKVTLKPIKQSIGKTWMALPQDSQKDSYVETLKKAFVSVFDNSKETIDNHLEGTLKRIEDFSQEKLSPAELLEKSESSVAESLVKEHCYDTELPTGAGFLKPSKRFCVDSVIGLLAHRLTDEQALISMNMRFEAGAMSLAQVLKTQKVAALPEPEPAQVNTKATDTPVKSPAEPCATDTPIKGGEPVKR